MELAAEHLTLAGQRKNLREIIKANNELAITHTLLGKPDSALFFIEESIEIAQQMNDSVQLGILYMNHGNVLCSTGRLKDGVRRYFESLYIFEKLDVKPLHQADLNHNLGLIYMDLGLDEIARPYVEKALLLYQQKKGVEAVGTIWLNLSKIYYNLGKLDDAKSALQRARTMLEDESNLSSLSTAYLMAAYIYEEEHRSDSAGYFLNLGLQVRMEIGNANQILEAVVESLSFSLRNNIRISQEEKEKLTELIRTSTDLKITASGYRLLHKLYKLDGKEALALQMLESYTICSDSLESERDKFTIIREELQSDFDNKMLNVQLQNERIKAANELKHLKRLFFLSFLSLLTLLTIIWFVRRRFKANALEKATLLQEIETLKNTGTTRKNVLVTSFELHRENLERFLEKKLNETDWSVLNVLVENPVISNKDLASRVFLSPDGVGSSLRRMYEMFEVAESKYMKIGLLLKAMKISNAQ